jgi:hypothetical protein
MSPFVWKMRIRSPRPQHASYFGYLCFSLIAWDIVSSEA